MKFLTRWWSKPIILTEKESKIYKICQLILSMPDVEVKPQDFGYVIRSQKIDYFMHVNSSGLSYRNHNFTHVQNYREDFLNLIKATMKAKIESEINEILDEIEKNDNDLLDLMINQLETAQ